MKISHVTLIVLIMISILNITALGFTPNNIRQFLVSHPSLPVENPSLSHKIAPAAVNIHKLYTSEPAPMGIGDYGIYPNGTAYICTTNQIEGVLNIFSLSGTNNLGSSSIESFISAQLNVVLTYQVGGQTCSLWIQDVAFIDTSNNFIIFVDEIFNFSSTFANLTGITGNGKISSTSYDGNTFTYYSYIASSNDPGNCITLNYPVSVRLLINVTTTSSGQPEILFWYNDGHGWINFDKVVVNNAFGATNVEITINGHSYTGVGSFYDAELVIVGPSEGATATIQNANVILELLFWNGHNFQEVKNAYDFGSDTAETSTNVQVIGAYNPNTGIPEALFTTGSSGLGMIWGTNQISLLTVNTNIQNGYYLVFNSSLNYQELSGSIKPFYNGQVQLTLNPGTYGILIYNQQGQIVGEANVETSIGSISTNVGQFSISSPPTATVFQGFATPVNITINAYGYVTLSVQAPSSISYSIPNNPVYIDGEGTAKILINAPQTGTYSVTITATLFPGVSKTIQLTIVSVQPIVSINLNYKFVGNSPTTTPSITFIFPNGTKVTLTLPISIKVPIGTKYTLLSPITSNGYRWIADFSSSGVINNTLSLTLLYYEQVQINFNFNIIGNSSLFSQPQITYYYLGHQQTSNPSTLWVDYGSTYSYSQILPGSNNQYRAISYDYIGKATSPGSVTVTYYVQFYINLTSPISIYALINGQNKTLSSGWYNYSTTIQIENISYYQNSGEREVITLVQPSSTFEIKYPQNIIVKTVTQYYVDVVSPTKLFAIINNVNETLSSGWYNVGTQIVVENVTYYSSPVERYIFLSISPRSVTVTNPVTININALEQFYITVNSQIPVYALINGENQTLKSGWYNYSTTIQIENISYYLSPTVRYEIIGVSTGNVIEVNKAYTVNVNSVKQYLVNINTQYPVSINGVTTNTLWVTAGSTITINANLPFYLSGQLTGTENIPLGQSITVNEPLNETLQTSISIAFLGLIIGIIAISGAVPVVIKKKMHKTNLPTTQPSITPPPIPQQQQISTSQQPRTSPPVYSPQMLANWDPQVWVGKELYGYKVSSVIGKGGNGYVLKAELGTNDYAIKIFIIYSPSGGTITVKTKSTFEQIYNESANLRRLSEHPNIVKIYGVHIDMNVIGEILKGNVNTYLNHPPAIVMEYMKGGSVDKLTKDTALTNSQYWPLIVKEIIKQVTSALAYIHSNGYVHLDIKPQNIFLLVYPQGTPENVYKQIMNNVKLGDLGSAVRAGTRIEQVTPAYAPPDQVEAIITGKGADPKMDIFALGMTAYVLLTGKNDCPSGYYLNKAIDEYINGNIANAINYINQAKQELQSWKVNLPLNTPIQLREFIERALSPDPAKRPTADEILVLLG